MSRAACIALCLLAARAHASPRSDPTIGRTVFTGATVQHPTSIELNPAALGVGAKNEIYIAALAAVDQFKIDHRGVTTTGHVSDTTLSPGGTLAGLWHTGTDGKITLAGQFRSAPAERFLESHDPLQYSILGGYHRTGSADIAASFRITNRWYFGIGLSAQISWLRLRYARDTALEAGRDPARGIDSDCEGSPCGIENASATEVYDVDVNTGILSASNVIGATIGTLVKLPRDIWLGASYHLPPGLAVQNTLTGTIAVERAPRDGGNTITGASTVYLSQPASVDVEVRKLLVSDIDLHIGGRWEDLSRMSTYDVRAFGSTFAAQGIPEWMPRARGFHDSYALWGGIEQVETGQFVRGGGRIGFETSTIPDERTTAWTIQPASLTLDGGVQVLLVDRGVGHARWLLQLTYGLQYFPTVSVDNSEFDPNSRLTCYDSGFDYSTAACNETRKGYGLPTANGDYSRIEHAFRLGLRYEL
ncbi:MAG TPA: hypothetical protein VMZ53_31980 [Kofleriaceae bacterium]|nr:hypothetical protein [Kofleriaceae bacterium]